jgi:putative SOS response-associated peptidase YedK
MTFAGLWDEWKDKATGEVLKSCAMLITEPNDFVAEVHDRMPVSLNPTISRRGSTMADQRCSDPHRTTCWPVSRRVNSSRAPADDPILIGRAEAT